MLAAHLAVEAERSGDSAWVIDTDRQATLSLWHERRQNDTPQRMDAPVERMPQALSKIAEQGAPEPRSRTVSPALSCARAMKIWLFNLDASDIVPRAARRLPQAVVRTPIALVEAVAALLGSKI